MGGRKCFSNEFSSSRYITLWLIPVCNPVTIDDTNTTPATLAEIYVVTLATPPIILMNISGFYQFYRHSIQIQLLETNTHPPLTVNKLKLLEFLMIEKLMVEHELSMN